MKMEIAKNIVERIKLCDIHLNEICVIVESIEDEHERKIMRKRCAEVTGVIYSEILRPIEIEYPSLRI
jgi:hypothetical protein